MRDSSVGEVLRETIFGRKEMNAEVNPCHNRIDITIASANMPDIVIQVPAANHRPQLVDEQLLPALAWLHFASL